MTSSFLAEAHRRQTRMTLRIWEHECCGDMYWSGGSRCDRCGEISTTLVTNLSVAEAMAGHPLLPLRFQPKAPPAAAETPQPQTTAQPPLMSTSVAIQTTPALLVAPPTRVSAEVQRQTTQSQRGEQAGSGKMPVQSPAGAGAMTAADGGPHSTRAQSLNSSLPVSPLNRYDVTEQFAIDSVRKRRSASSYVHRSSTYRKHQMVPPWLTTSTRLPAIVRASFCRNA